VIREVRPQVVVTLKAAGGGGHPDHLHATLATRVAFARAGDPGAWPEQLTGPDALAPWAPSKLYETHGQTRAQLDRMTKIRYVVHDQGPVRALPVIARAMLRLRSGREDAPAAVVDDRPAATTRIAVGPWMDARNAALRAYRTQIAPGDELLELTPVQLRRLSPTEDFTLCASQAWQVPEDDLFSGLACTWE
jgi:mycothiol S-conjugate amidase